MIEGLPLWFISAVVGTLGAPGVVLILWYVDHRRLSHQREEDRKEIARQREADNEKLQAVLDQYEKDVTRVTRFYESNVQLVENYEKLSGELMQVIQLNTQVQTRLVERIDNNMFCPMVREKGAA